MWGLLCCALQSASWQSVAMAESSADSAPSSSGVTYRVYKVGRRTNSLAGPFGAAPADAQHVSHMQDESDLPVVMRLIDNELSEPYTIYTYRCAPAYAHMLLSQCCA